MRVNRENFSVVQTNSRRVIRYFLAEGIDKMSEKKNDHDEDHHQHHHNHHNHHDHFTHTCRHEIADFVKCTRDKLRSPSAGHGT
jgi:hypothetical protein